MAHLNNFDATKIAPSVPFEPIPAGKYPVVLTASTTKPTKSGHGDMLELTFTVIEGEYRNRRVWDYLCIQHPESRVSSIARANLSAICHAVGVLHPKDTVELHNIPLCIQVGLKKDPQTGVFRNTVRSYTKLPEAITTPDETAEPVDETIAPWGT